MDGRKIVANLVIHVALFAQLKDDEAARASPQDLARQKAAVRSQP